jgi:hypothetical protein
LLRSLVLLLNLFYHLQSDDFNATTGSVYDQNENKHYVCYLAPANTDVKVMHNLSAVMSFTAKAISGSHIQEGLQLILKVRVVCWRSVSYCLQQVIRLREMPPTVFFEPWQRDVLVRVEVQRYYARLDIRGILLHRLPCDHVETEIITGFVRS